jgi:hypothetical protein
MPKVNFKETQDVAPDDYGKMAPAELVEIGRAHRLLSRCITAAFC